MTKARYAPVPAVTGSEWQRFAACQDADPELFFDADRVGEALAVCRRCPVVSDCLNTALAYGMWQWGVQGGMTAEKRTSEYRSRGRRNRQQVLANTVKPAKSSPEPKKKISPPRKGVSLRRVDATGTRRRLRALAVVGHSPPAITTRTSASASYLHDVRSGACKTVLEETAREIADLFPVLLSEPPATRGDLAAVHAATRGWPGADAWVGVDIDAPDARPRETATAA